MDPHCSQCGEHLAESWIFCARCGAHIPRMVEPIKHPDPEKAPVGTTFGGAYLGFIAMPIMLIFGVMLCLTGWGIFIGIPVIIGALLAPLAGPLMGMGAAKGKVF